MKAMSWFKFMLTSESDHVADLTILAPVSGVILPIEDVPDVVFSEKIIGDGVAIQPSDGIVVAPCKCTVREMFNTKHAVVLRTESYGIELFIHVGIDTVDLAGEGFTSSVAEGDLLSPGDPIIKFDLKGIQKSKTLITPVVISSQNNAVIKTIEKLSGNCQAGVTPIIKIDIDKEATKKAQQPSGR